MLALLLAAAPAAAQQAAAPAAPDADPSSEARRRLEIWDIALGTPVDRIPANEFIDWACGTNGGPPGRPLAGPTQFAECPADEHGLHEVHFRYDDELEYIAKAMGNETMILLWTGTTAYSIPVVVSLLVDDAGVVRGERIVTDPRTDNMGERQLLYSLNNYMRARFEGQGLDCVDLPPDEGETPVAGLFVKQRCETVDNSRQRVLLEANLYRKPGQAGIDPHTHLRTSGEFESSARVEIYDPSVPAEG